MCVCVCVCVCIISLSLHIYIYMYIHILYSIDLITLIYVILNRIQSNMTYDRFTTF